MPSAEIGVFGGSGFYSFVDGLAEHRVNTPYGPPSAPLSIGEVAGRSVAFIPRHGPHHEIPPHSINYRANLWAFAELGVRRVLAPAAAGSLQPHIHPGDVVVCDQLVDRTSGRPQTYYDGPLSVHVSWADPYCPELRAVAVEAVRAAEMNVHERGTVVVVQGPRFSTRAESRHFQQQGWEVINMTQFPEAYLARELQMCYVNLSLITDYDVGVEGRPEIGAVTMEEALRVFAENIPRLRRALLELIGRIPGERACSCGDALKGTPADPGSRTPS
jgi:5'-methylthioadenosine phosphorylase